VKATGKERSKVKVKLSIVAAIASIVVMPNLGLAQGKGDAKAGKAKYDSFCAGCHGATGKGDGAAAAALNPKPGDFTDCKTMAGNSDEFLHKIIKEGGAAVKKSPMMPTWGASLSDQDISNVVSYIRSLCKK
jgi:cytochrome c oxidase cbb3-type subunit 3